MKPVEIISVIVTAALGFGALLVWQAYEAPILGGLFAMLGVICYGISAMYSKKLLLLRLLLAAIFITPLYFLPLTWGYAASVAVAIILALWSLEQIWRERNASPIFNIWRVLRAGMPLIFTALSLVIAAFSYYTERETNTVRLIPKPLFEILLPHTMNLISGTLGIPGTLRPDATVDEAIISQFAESPEANEAYLRAPESTKRAFLAEARDEISQRLDISLSGDETVSDALYRAMNKKADDVLAAYRQYVPLVLAAGVFFAVRALSIPLYALAIVICYGASWLLRKLGALEKQTFTIELTRYTF